MTDNYVTLMGQFTDGTNYASGNYEFMTAGTLMDSGAIGIVVPVILGQLDDLGAFSKVGIDAPTNLADNTVAANTGIPLIASDNFGQTNGQYNLMWNFKIIVSGMPNIVAYNIPLLYASGATQDLFTVLEAGGWVAPQSPAYRGTGT